MAKKVPVTVVDDKSKADFEITGHSETQKASTAKKVIMWDWHSNEQASIQVNNLKSGEVGLPTLQINRAQFMARRAPQKLAQSI